MPDEAEAPEQGGKPDAPSKRLEGKKPDVPSERGEKERPDVPAERGEKEKPDVPSERGEGERIAKWLARAGIASRRDVERLIEERRVKLGGRVVTTPATFVQEGDTLEVDNQLVAQPQRTRLFRYHKPAGLVTTHRDPEGRPTVFDKMPPGLPRVISVGRLDLTSEGLLLLTNDGALSRRLELPANGWLRRYRVRVFGHPDPDELAALARGVTIERVHYGAIDAALDTRQGDNAWLTIALQEGKNREIRRVLEFLGFRVSRLIRLAYGPFQLGALPKGAVEEVNAKVLREQLGVAPPGRAGDGSAPKRGRR